MKKAAILIDDVLNDFSQVLNQNKITFDRRVHSFGDPIFKSCLYNITAGNLTDIGSRVLTSTKAIPDGVAFVQWIKSAGWEVTLCTDRDLRIASSITKRWLNDNNIPYDCLFQIDDRVRFCADMHIQFLINEKPITTTFPLKIYYPSISADPSPQGTCIGFDSFTEVKKWMA